MFWTTFACTDNIITGGSKRGGGWVVGNGLFTGEAKGLHCTQIKENTTGPA